MKTYLGFDGYQIRSERAIKRFWLLIQFTYLIAMDLKKTTFNEAIREVRAAKNSSIIEFIYQQAKIGVPLENVKNELNAA